MKMPEMGGIEATEILREKFKNESRLLIIALTADVLLENEGKLASRGFDDIMVKPINKAKLGMLLKKWITF